MAFDRRRLSTPRCAFWMSAPAPPQAAAPQAAAPRGPTAADVQAAQQMSPQDRQQMIRGMVDEIDSGGDPRQSSLLGDQNNNPQGDQS